jgi:VIT1/CCC1 family predicted Fe2+/Mn2+ transporter
MFTIEWNMAQNDLRGPLTVFENSLLGVVMFCSFAFFGAMPLLGYVIIPISFPDLDSSVLFQAACVVTGLVLFLLGSIKSNFS